MPKAYVFYQVPLGPDEEGAAPLLKSGEYMIRLAVGEVAQRWGNRQMNPGGLNPFQALPETIAGKTHIPYFPNGIVTQGAEGYFRWRSTGFAGGIALVLLPPQSEAVFLLPVLRAFLENKLGGQGIEVNPLRPVSLRLTPADEGEGFAPVASPKDLITLREYVYPGARIAQATGQLRMPLHDRIIDSGLVRKDGSPILLDQRSGGIARIPARVPESVSA